MRGIRLVVPAVVAVVLAFSAASARAQTEGEQDAAWWEQGASRPPQTAPAEQLSESVMRARGRLAEQLRRVERSEADIVPRVVLEMLAGYAGGVAGVLAGALFGWLACSPLEGSYEPDAWSCHGGRGAVMGVLASSFTAATMGAVYDALGGMPTTMGGVGALGGAAGYVALGQTLAMTMPDPAIADDIGGGMLLALIPLLTNVLAIELADDAETDAVRRTSAVLPSITALRNHGGDVVGAFASVRVEL